MYFKIENKKSEVYKKLYDMRKKEIKMGEDNIKAIEEKTGQKWKRFLGHNGQQNWGRVTVFTGFEFENPEKLNPKIWKKHNEHETIYVPNRRTKLGREMADFINKQTNGHWFTIVYDNLGLEHPNNKFFFPYVEIVKNNIIVLMLDERQNLPTDENLIEITTKEFDKLRSA